MPVLSPRLREHPCFGGCAAGCYGRIHLPVAPKCNVQCVFCDRRYDCVNESRPGVTSRILTPEEASRLAAETVAREPRIRVVGIAGPGDPLANPETFETLRLVRQQLPEAILCLSTNGLWLEERMDCIAECGVDTLTVTLNSLRPETAGKLYRYVTSPQGRLTGPEAGAYMIKKQRSGLNACLESGCTVKINTVLIPGINDSEIPEIARFAGKIGAAVMNVLPLIPCGALSHFPPPTEAALCRARREVKKELPVFTHCRQCRADAVGIL